MAEPNPYEEGTRKSPPRLPTNTTTGEWVPGDDSGVQLAVPQRIGRFEVKAVLGVGSYGRVFLALDPEMGRQVAIKQPFGEGLKPEYRDDFLKEARAAAVIDQHANVCPVYHIDTDAGLPYIVMRFVPGGTLKNLLDRRIDPLPVRTALIIARKIALGLTAAHAKGIIHRDLKPANVLIDDANSEVLITDFGLARIASRAQAAATINRGAHGTPYYMPPEQWGSQAFGPITPVADVYSLGVILYEMLAGEPPFTGSQFELMTQHCTQMPRLPSRVRPDLDPRLDTICLKAMEKQPANRYRSAKEFADKLNEYLRGDDIEPINIDDAARHRPQPDRGDIEPLPLGDELPDAPSPAHQRSAPPPLPWAEPLANPAPRKPGAASPNATTSQPAATMEEKEVVRCPKCNSRLEIVKNRTRPIDCPMCNLKFAVDAGRQAAARASGGRRERPVVAEPVRRRSRRNDYDNDDFPRRHWLPAARGLRLTWIGIIISIAFACFLGLTAIAQISDEDSARSNNYTRTPSTGKSSEYSSSTSRSSTRRDSDAVVFHVAYAGCGVGIALGLFVMSLGRMLAARLPEGVAGRGAASVGALTGWGGAACLAMMFVLMGFLLEERGDTRPGENTLSAIMLIAGAAAFLLLLIGEFAFNSYFTAIGRHIRRGFPRALATVAKVCLWVFLACAIFGGIAIGVAAAIENKDAKAMTFLMVITGGASCISMALLPFWGLITIWLNIHAAVAVSRYAHGEEL